MVDLHEFYAKNDKFKQYVDKYCKTRHIDKETALSHEIVRQTAKYYDENKDAAEMPVITEMRG